MDTGHRILPIENGLDITVSITLPQSSRIQLS